MVDDIEEEFCFPDCFVLMERLFSPAGGGRKQCNSAKPSVFYAFLIHTSVLWSTLTICLPGSRSLG